MSFSQNNNLSDYKSDYKKDTNKINDDTYYKYAIKYYNINFDSVLFYTKKAIKYSEKYNKNKLNKARYLLICGVAYKNVGKPDSAVFCYNEAIKIFYFINNNEGVASAKNNLGILYTELGKFKKANKEYVEAIRFFNKINDTLNIAEVYLNLGELCTKINCFDKAYLYFDNAKTNYKLVKSEPGIAFVLSGIANLKIKENKLDTALKYYFNAVNIWKQIDRNKETGKIYIQIGNIYKQKNELTKAVKYYKQAIKNFKNVNYQYGIVESSALLSTIYIETKKYAKAKQMLIKLIDVTKKINAEPILSDIYKDLYIIFKENKDYKNAIFYYEKYNNLKDKLFNINNNKNIIEIQSKYDILVNQKQIEKLKDSTKISKLIIEKNKLKVKQQQNLSIVLSISIIVAIIFILLLYHRFVTSKQLSKKITIALNDRETLLKELHHRVKNNLQLISSLLNLQSNSSKNKSPDEILEISRNRISTMLMIHENLYKSKNFKYISLKKYVKDLAKNLTESTNIKSRNIKIKTNIQDIELDINKLIPCGLIINELVTNSIKHAFKNKNKGDIFITSENNGDMCKISITDNGTGLPKDFNIDKTISLGLKLVKGLTKQINGEFIIDKTTHGSKFFIIFRP